MRLHHISIIAALALAAASSITPSSASAQQCGSHSYQAEVARQLLADHTRGPIQGCADGICLSTDRRSVATLEGLTETTAQLWLCELDRDRLSACETLSIAPTTCNHDSCTCYWTGCVDGVFADLCSLGAHTELQCHETLNHNGVAVGWTCQCVASTGTGVPLSSKALQQDAFTQARARRAVLELHNAQGGDPGVPLGCGGGPGISPGIQSWFGCSLFGKLCYVNIGDNGQIDSGDCTSCGGGGGQPSCTPWDSVD